MLYILFVLRDELFLELRLKLAEYEPLAPAYNPEGMSGQGGALDDGRRAILRTRHIIEHRGNSKKSVSGSSLPMSDFMESLSRPGR